MEWLDGLETILPGFRTDNYSYTYPFTAKRGT